MSGFDFSTTNLLETIKRYAFVPISQITFSDADLLNMADEEIQTALVPFMMKTREEYLVTFTDTYVDGTSRVFEMPTRAIGAKLRAVTVLINPNNDQDQPNERKLPEINAEDSVFNNNYNNFLSLQAFYLRENNIILSPGASSYAGQTLRMYYFKRPSKLIETSACAQVTAISGQTAIVSLVPTTFGSGGTLTITADLVKAAPPFRLYGMDLTVTIDTTTNTATIPLNPMPTEYHPANYGLSVGDYICLAGESPIPTLPVELMSVLAQRVAVKILASLGDSANFQIATDRLKDMEHNALELLSNRVEGSNRKVVNQFTTFNNAPYRRF